MALAASWVCAVAAGKHIHRKVILGHLPASGILLFWMEPLTAWFHQHHPGIPTGFASWAGVCRLASSACSGVTATCPCCCQGIVTQGRALRDSKLEFDGDSELGKTAAGYVSTGAWVGVKARNKMFLLGAETPILGSWINE